MSRILSESQASKAKICGSHGDVDFRNQLIIACNIFLALLALVDYVAAFATMARFRVSEPYLVNKHVGLTTDPHWKVLRSSYSSAKSIGRVSARSLMKKYSEEHAGNLFEMLKRGKAADKENKMSQILRRALGSDQTLPEWANQDSIYTMNDLKVAFSNAGVESLNLIVGIDFTKSNVDQGTRTFGGRSLHAISRSEKNPYQLVIDMITRTLAPRDEDNSIPMYCFGDITTRHTSVSLMGNTPCEGLGILSARYQELAPKMQLSGPTSFAPLIYEAVKIVRESGGKYHILLIVGDGAVSDSQGCWEATKTAIIKASMEPLSIIMVGVGDGPWDLMKNFDDELPERKFDNFQFVPFAPFQEELSKGNLPNEDKEAIESAFTIAALQEVPDQYRAMSKLNLIEQPGMYRKATSPLSDVTNWLQSKD